MKALVFTDYKTLVYRDEAEVIAKKGEELIRVKASGICGTDLHAYHGLDEKRTPPLILGHEISGINHIDKTPVVINPLISCRNCKECLNKCEHLCDNRVFIGMSKPVNKAGGFADFIAMPSNNIIKIPKDFNVQQAALTEPSAVALHAINLASKHSRTKINHSNILIIGGGAIGLLVALILKSKGANRTTILDTNYKRLEACQKASSSIIAHPDDKKIKSKNYEIIFDAVGYEITRNKSLECVKQGGIVVHIGLSQKAGEFDFLKLTRQEIILIGSFAYTNNEFKHSLNMLFKGVLGNLSWLNYLPLKEGAAAFKEIHEGKISAPKIILIP